MHSGASGRPQGEYIRLVSGELVCVVRLQPVTGRRRLAGAGEFDRAARREAESVLRRRTIKPVHARVSIQQCLN